MLACIQHNILALEQGESLLASLDDFTYRRALQVVFGSSIGTHIRHNLDHYACFLSGIETSCIDYAARRRDTPLERDRSAALVEIARLCNALMALGDPAALAGTLHVRREADIEAVPVVSSIERELDFLLSHTVHHYAIVAILCRLQGRRHPRGFWRGAVHPAPPGALVRTRCRIVCTLTWKPLDDGYVLFFNRDEQRSRPLAHPPAIHVRDGIRFIAPLDPQGGGSWLLANEYGLAVALLNHYPPAPHPAPRIRTSRGALVMAAAACANVNDALACIETQCLKSHMPFQCVAMNANAAHVVTWNGRTLTRSHLQGNGAMLTSSSSQPKTTLRARQALMQRLLGTVDSANPSQIETFHAYFDNLHPARGVNMARVDACTHSISRVRVTTHETTFDYLDRMRWQVGSTAIINFGGTK